MAVMFLYFHTNIEKIIDEKFGSYLRKVNTMNSSVKNEKEVDIYVEKFSNIAKIS